MPKLNVEIEPMKEYVEALIKKAAEADKSEDAMRFSQAATNAANALIALKNLNDP